MGEEAADYRLVLDEEQGVQVKLPAYVENAFELLVHPKNSVRVTLQGLTSFGKMGILRQDDGIFNPGGIWIRELYCRIQKIASPTVCS